MISLDQYLPDYKCPKCNGQVMIDSDILPDSTYELVCIRCGNRSFPKELEITVNMLIKLKGKP